MREIKFRAWHKEQNKMYSAEEMGIDQLTLMTDGRGFANISGQDTRLSRIDNGKHMIPLQYTGLKDKNGKEIYEGDIVKCPTYPTESNPMGEPFFGIVIYLHGAFCYQYKTLYCESLISLYDSDEAYEDEVIGNIYENPELLEKND